MDILIRNEVGSDHRTVEELTREAFWNLYIPGCNEHYLVHVMRNSEDFINELDFVALIGDKIVGNIMYMHSSIINEKNEVLDTLTFGPVSVLPEFQKQGIGSALIKYSIKKATEKGYKAIIIFGHPHNYCKHGFKSSRDFSISNHDGKYPSSLLALELQNGVFGNHSWKFTESKAYNLDERDVEEFDKSYQYKEKKYTYTQEEFSIASRAFLE